MSSYPRSPHRDIPPIGDAAVEALLAGSLPPADADAELRPLAEAIGYALNNWRALNHYADVGYLSIGRVERWRGGLGQAHPLPALSSAGASLA